MGRARRGVLIWCVCVALMWMLEPFCSSIEGVCVFSISKFVEKSFACELGELVNNNPAWGKGTYD